MKIHPNNRITETIDKVKKLLHTASVEIDVLMSSYKGKDVDEQEQVRLDYLTGVQRDICELEEKIRY